mmetsp:Transcript_17909/g.43076  ORF Transcript_17909/g.43076 Transcript_17909/m.43076 type:complete len:317 (+) Transcript_17909:273-1223(+)
MIFIERRMTCLLLSLRLLALAVVEATTTLPYHENRGFGRPPLAIGSRRTSASTTMACCCTASKIQGRRKKTALPCLMHSASDVVVATASTCFVSNLSFSTRSFSTTRRRRRRDDPKTKMHLKFKTFDDMLTHHADTPILIDFYAPWCGPCKLLKSELASIRSGLEKLGGQGATATTGTMGQAASMKNSIVDEGLEQRGGHYNEENDNDAAGRGDKEEGDVATKARGIPVYHVNANKFPQVGAKNNIHGLPTLVLFFEGKELWRNEGIMSGEAILETLEGLNGRGWRSELSSLEGEERGGGEGDGNDSVAEAKESLV